MFANFTKTAIAAAMILAAVSAAAAAAPFKLTSPDIGPGKPFTDKFIFNGLGCAGANASPELDWSNPPAGTQSFALMVHDPDAQTGGAGIWQWVVINIPATAKSLPAGAGAPDGSGLPPGAKEVSADYGPMYGGPCPPPGARAHRYNFTLYALKVPTLEVPPGATASVTGFFINMNAIGQAKLTALYGRK